MSEILKFGVDKLLSSDESSIQDVDLRQILGLSRKGQWVMDEEHVIPNESDEEEDEDMEGQSKTLNSSVCDDHILLPFLNDIS